MKISRALKVLSASLAFAGLAKAFCAAENPVNIIYIMTDDHSYQTYAAYGGPLKDIVKTPNLDRLAREGMRFDRCYVTNSLCGPSRATLLTGKHSHANGFFANTHDMRFDGAQTTFPKILQANGYQTAIVGKWHLESDPTGFDYWDILNGQGRYYNPIFITKNGQNTEEGYNSDVIGDKALNWIKNRDKVKPFMIMVHFKGVHSEWAPALRHANMYDNVNFPLPPTFDDDYSTRGYAAHHQEMNISKYMEDSRLLLDGAPKGANKEQSAAWQKAFVIKDKEFFEGNNGGKVDTLRRYQRFMQNYCATLAGVDDNIGRILDYLKENGLDENTLVIYTSDQGFYMGEHGWFDKRFMYEESFRTPLVMRWKGKIEAGSASDAVVQNLDFAETILDAAGCKIPFEMQGISLKPIMFKGGEAPADWRKSIYYRFYEWPGIHMAMRHEGVLMGKEKLIHFYPLDEWEYYDLDTDPSELNNRINDPKAQERVAMLKTELEKLRKTYNAPACNDTEFQPKQLQVGLKIIKENPNATSKDILPQIRKNALKKN